MSWLKKPPAKAPPPPPRASLEILIAHEQALEAAGHPDPALAYVRQNAATVELDSWGNPLPLSDGDQDQVDGLTWLLGAPLQRLTDLLRSGLIGDAEVEAVKAVFPEAYQSLSASALSDLVEAGPPIESWAECALSVLFQQPIESVYTSQAPTDGKPQPDQQSPKPIGDGATQADRRDPANREGT